MKSIQLMYEASKNLLFEETTEEVLGSIPQKAQTIRSRNT